MTINIFGYHISVRKIDKFTAPPIDKAARKASFEATASTDAYQDIRAKALAMRAARASA